MNIRELLLRTEAAERTARVTRGLPPDHLTDFSHFPFAFALNELAEFDSAAAAWLANEPETPAAFYFAALSALAHRDYEKANQHMDRCASLRRDDGRERMRFGIKIDPTAMSLPPVYGDYPRESALFICCDAKYFSWFCLPLLKSLAASKTAMPVHIHLFDAAVEMAVEKLRSIGISASVTWEDPRETIRTLNLPHPALYYGAVRLIRFTEALEQSLSSLWITDVDALVTGDIGRLASIDAPYAMRVRAGRLEPFHQYSACLIKGTPASLPYFRATSNIIKADLPFAWWGLDQYALFSAAVGYSKNPLLIGPEVASVADHTPGLFWYTAGRAKESLGTATTNYAALYRSFAKKP